MTYITNNSDTSPKQNDPETYAIIGAAQRVHAALRYGFYEKVYQDALEIEFRHAKIPYIREKAITISYRNEVLGSPYFADFLCYGEVIVELKAIKRLTKVDEAQVIHYLHTTGKTRALLFNFGATSLEVRRFINGNVYEES